MMENQFEAKQSEQNFFYNSIKEKLINTEVTAEFDKIIKNNYQINNTQYELLGNIAYFFGNEFVSGQASGFNKLILTNFQLRMDEVKIIKEHLEKFNDIMQHLEIANIEKTKDNLKELVLKDCQFKGETLHKLKSNVNAIFRDSNFSISICIDVDELMKAKSFTYGQLLKINKIIYENINIAGSSFKNLRQIYALPEFQEKIKKASDYFDLQKFTLVYFDLILSLKEYFEVDNSRLEYVNYFNNSELIESLELPVANLENNPEENNTELETTKVISEIEKNPVLMYTPDDTDHFLYGIFYEVNAYSHVLNSDNLFEIIQKIAGDLDLIQYVYQFFKTNIDKNRINFEKVFGFSKETLLVQLNTELENNNSKYKKLVESYLAPIDENIHQKIVQYINDLITSVIVDNTERKSYLFQQLNENQIFTYKHLHQTIGLIEECNIKGSDINSYTNLRDYLMNKINIKELFESVSEIEEIQTQIQFYSAIKDFYSHEIVENENENIVNLEALETESK